MGEQATEVDIRRLAGPHASADVRLALRLSAVVVRDSTVPRAATQVGGAAIWKGEASMVSQNTASRSSEGAGVVAPAGQGRESLHEKAGQVVDQAQDKAGQLVDGAKQQAASRLAGCVRIRNANWLGRASARRFPASIAATRPAAAHTPHPSDPETTAAGQRGRPFRSSVGDSGSGRAVHHGRYRSGPPRRRSRSRA